MVQNGQCVRLLHRHEVIFQIPLDCSCFRVPVLVCSPSSRLVQVMNVDQDSTRLKDRTRELMLVTLNCLPFRVIVFSRVLHMLNKHLECAAAHRVNPLPCCPSIHHFDFWSRHRKANTVIDVINTIIVVDAFHSFAVSHEGGDGDRASSQTRLVSNCGGNTSPNRQSIPILENSLRPWLPLRLHQRFAVENRGRSR